ncbi:MAG: SprT-like domain-containing protein [Dehalococcoidia bacterium]|jgi:hypothetical protein
MLKTIINEEIGKFINEYVEYRDDEFIDPKQIDLQHEYDRLNVQLFENKLPRVPMVWSTRKRALGHVKYKRNRVSEEILVEHLAMSNFYRMSYRIFKDVMAHEMIHVKLFSNKDQLRQGNPHGRYFLWEADRINSMGLGFKITPVNTDQMEVSDVTKQNNARILIAIILNLDGKYYIMTITPSMFANSVEMEYLNKFFDYMIKRGRYRNAEVTFVETQNAEVLQAPLKRSFARGISYIPLSDELLGKLLDDKVIKTLQFGQGGVKQVAESGDSDWVEGIIV